LILKGAWMMLAVLLAVIAAMSVSAGPPVRPSARRSQDPWKKTFAVDKADLQAVGRNRFFVLEPGYAMTYEDGPVRLTITVLPEARVVDGVTTRVVEERETRAGQVVEVSRNFFAISRRTQDVYYFGEEVDNYQGGRIVNHEGSWLSGVGSARFGLMMPGTPVRGSRYYQEQAPRVALDRARILSVNEAVTTPAGQFRDCLRVEETTPLEPSLKEYKYYAPGVGLVQDGSLKLVRFGPAT
jgi:hypothetical protein